MLLASLVVVAFAALPSGAAHANPDWVSCAANSFGPKCEGWRVTVVNDASGQGTAPVSSATANGTTSTMTVRTSASDNAPAGFVLYRASANGTPATTVGIGAVEGYAHARYVRELVVSGPGEYTVTISVSLASVTVSTLLPPTPQPPVRVAQGAAGLSHTVIVYPCALEDTCAQSDEPDALGNDSKGLATGDAAATLSATVTVPASATTAKLRVEFVLDAKSIVRGPGSAQANADATLTSVSCQAPAGQTCS